MQATDGVELGLVVWRVPPGIAAVFDYVRAGRPAVNDRHVFLTCRTPFSLETTNRYVEIIVRIKQDALSLREPLTSKALKSMTMPTR